MNKLLQKICKSKYINHFVDKCKKYIVQYNITFLLNNNKYKKINKFICKYIPTKLNYKNKYYWNENELIIFHIIVLFMFLLISKNK